MPPLWPAGTLRSGGVQAVWQEGLRAGDAARRLVWHAEGGPGATWVPRRHEGLREGHKQDSEGGSLEGGVGT